MKSISMFGGNVLRALSGLGLLLFGRAASQMPRLKRDEKRRPARTGRRGGLWTLLKTTGTSWVNDRAPKMAAALAYYTAFAIAPLLLIAIAVAGLLFGQEAARGQVVDQIGNLVGQRGAETIQEILVHAWQ